MPCYLPLNPVVCNCCCNLKISSSVKGILESKFGKIDTGVLSQIADVSLNDIINFIKEKDFGAIRKWVASNDVDPASLYRKLYDNLYDFLKPQSIPQAVIILADYQYKQAFVADAEINLVACLTELMVSLEFK